MNSNFSRRELYAHGEPLGESVTRRKVGGGYICGGGGGGGSSSSSTSTTTQNYDKRVAVETGIGLSSDSSTVNINTLDANIVQKALDTVAVSDATNAQGYQSLLKTTDAGVGKLLTLAEKLFDTGSKVLETTQGATLKQVEALGTMSNDKAGSIDQKTIIVLAVAGAAAMFALRKR